jgi:hypothetical protein
MFGRQRLKISCLSITRHTKHGLKLETRLGGSGFFETVPKALSVTKPGYLRCWSVLNQRGSDQSGGPGHALGPRPDRPHCGPTPQLVPLSNQLTYCLLDRLTAPLYTFV